MKIEFNFESPYNPDGSPHTDLPTGEVLAWDGKEWANGFLYLYLEKEIRLIDSDQYLVLSNVVRVAPLPTIYEDGNEIF